MEQQLDILKVVVYNSSTKMKSAILFGHNRFMLKTNFGSDSDVMYRAYLNGEHIPYIESLCYSACFPSRIDSVQIRLKKDTRLLPSFVFMKYLMKKPPNDYSILSVLTINKSKNEVLNASNYFKILFPSKTAIVFTFNLEKP